jgi:hypothetical protein
MKSCSLKATHTLLILFPTPTLQRVLTSKITTTKSNKKYFPCEVIKECTFCKHCGSPGCSEASFPCERARATDPPGHSCIAYIRMQKRAIIISKHVYSITERAREAAPGTRTIWRALFHSPERRRINVRPRPNSRWIAHSKMYNRCR